MHTSLWNPIVIVAALGYFVDIYDLLLFNIVRVPSLRSIGYAGRELEVGATLHNIQVIGLMIGGVLWGMLGDKRGRLSVLFGSIILYSAANLANAFVQNFTQYAILRLIAGIGLAGELGAGITLVAETLPKHLRGYGTMMVASIGVMGAIFAGIAGELFDWRTCYLIGGCLGFALLVLRFGVYESGLYDQIKDSVGVRGNFFHLFQKARMSRYLKCILIGVPVWYVIGILVAFSPEYGIALEVTGPVTAAKAILWCYAGLVFGDFMSGWISQRVQSRLKAVAGFLLLTMGVIVFHLMSYGRSPEMYYTTCFFLGFGAGYWAVLITIGVEQFGTNLRSTAGTTIPNFVRGSVVPMSLAFLAMKGGMGLIGAAATVGVVVFAVAFWALLGLRETFGTDLDYLEDTR